MSEKIAAALEKQEKAMEKHSCSLNLGKSPEMGRTVPMDRTEYEVNCMKNKVERVKSAVRFAMGLKDAGSGASASMDNGLTEKPTVLFANAYKTYVDDRNTINATAYCPSIHTYNAQNVQNEQDGQIEMIKKQ
jgi:hypothetical protein